MQSIFQWDRLGLVAGLWFISIVYLYFANLRLIIFSAFMLSLFFMGRMILIILGLYKAPILARFQKYGDEEDLFYPLPAFFLWLGIFALTGTAWFSTMTSFHFPGEVFGLIFLALALLFYRLQAYLLARPHEWWSYPRWLLNLQQRSSRLERRRIAYMWMRLPRRARLNYSSNDQAFLQWADFVILSTLR